MRCTFPSATSTSISEADLPLIGYHLERLREAHAHFAERDTHYWGEWPGDDSVTDKCLQVLREKAQEGEGDYRVRIVICPKGIVKVEVPPAPKDAGGFYFYALVEDPRALTSFSNQAHSVWRSRLPRWLEQDLWCLIQLLPTCEEKTHRIESLDYTKPARGNCTIWHMSVVVSALTFYIYGRV